MQDSTIETRFVESKDNFLGWCQRPLVA
jgi:hypothetical protein